jgi:hypothetical protein
MRPFLVVVAFFLLCAAPLGAQSVRGTLVASPGGQPVPGALVVLRDALGHTVDRAETEAGGRFELRAAIPGEFWVRAERAGYAALAPARVALAAGAPLELRLEAAAAGAPAARTAARVLPADTVPGDTATVRLEGITVTAEAAAHVLQLSGFYERKRAAGGGGAFLDAQAIADLRRARVVDVVTGQRGVSGFAAASGSAARPSARAYTARRFGARCTLPVYLDGILIPGAELDRLKPEHLAGVEVYVGAETPLRFQPRQTFGQICGAVVVWTRAGAR